MLQLTHPSKKLAVLQQDGFVCILLSDPKSSHTPALCMPEDPFPLPRASLETHCQQELCYRKQATAETFVPAHMASPDIPWREVQCAKHLPFASVPKPASNFQEPTGDVGIFVNFACKNGELQKRRSPPWTSAAYSLPPAHCNSNFHLL